MSVRTAPSAGSLRRRPGRRDRIQLIGLLISSAAFTGVAVDVAREGPLLRLDRHLSPLASPGDGGWLTRLAELLAPVGATPVQVATLAIVAVVLAVRHRRRHPLVLAAVAGFLLVALLIVLKASLGRIGPQDPPGDVPWGGAFPSGHAASAVVATTVMIHLVRDHLSAAAHRWSMAAALAWAGLIGWSRVQLDVHWFSDVLAGWALGIAVACAVCVVSGITTTSHRESSP